MIALLATIGRFVVFSLDVLRRIPASLARPRLILVEATRFVAGSLPLVVVIGACLGLIAWLHLGRELARFEAQSLLPSTLMLLATVELGPLAVGLIAAGRLASGMAAELAAMKTTEQLDAVRCLGMSPVERLLAPRVLACILVLPPLTIVVDYSAMLGVYLAESIAGETTWDAFRRSAVRYLDFWPVVLATAKTAVFGLLVGLFACWHGVEADSSTESVGTAATRAVVAAALAVIVSNVLLVRVIQWVT